MSEIKKFIEETKELVDKGCITELEAKEMMNGLADKLLSYKPFNLKGMKHPWGLPKKTIKDYLDNNDADSQK